MAKDSTTAPLALEARRRYPAPPERVFAAFTNPEAVKRWFVDPAEGRFTEEPVLDARPGGRYRFEGENGGKKWCVHGEYKEVDPPRRLVFTWLWEDYPNPGDSGDTLVSVDFLDRGGETEVVLRHERFANEPARQDHAKGWEECLAAIGRVLGESA
jgi:uncharacterized protein YndB with AHSA1/START domain